LTLPHDSFLLAIRCLIMFNIYARLFDIPPASDRVMVPINCLKQFFCIWPLSMTLTFDLTTRVLRATRWHISVSVCASYMNCCLLMTELRSGQAYPDERTDGRTHIHTPNHHCDKYVELSQAGSTKPIVYKLQFLVLNNWQ
jgi:hypothetical protein